MTADPTHLDAIADAEAALTPQVIAAKKAALDAKNRQIWTDWANGDATVAALDGQIADETALLGTAQTDLAAAQNLQATKTALTASRNVQIANLQAAIAAGGPPATPADVAERDEVVQLRAEVGV